MHPTDKIAIPRQPAAAASTQRPPKHPPAPSGPKRTRESKQKVKTGCLTCKIRKIKCDEEKPFCRRCTSTGRKCDGYLSPDTSQASSTAGDSPLTTPHESSDWSLVAPVSRCHDVGEGRSLAYYRANTASELSGFDDSHFWEILVPRAVEYEPAVRHAVLALSSLHERYMNADTTLRRPWSDDQGAFALQQYNKAIRHLVKPANFQHRPVDVSLIVCMLFACIESLRGHLGSSISHTHSGIKILYELLIKQSTPGNVCNSFTSLRKLEVLFNRLDYAATSITGQRAMTLTPDAADSLPGFTSHIPCAFVSLEEATNSLSYQLNCFAQDQKDAEVSFRTYSIQMEPYRDLSLRKFDEWQQAFNTFLLGKELTGRQAQQARILQLMHTYFYASTHAIADKPLLSEMNFDTYTSLFRRIITLAKEIVKYQVGTESKVAGTPLFSFDLQIVGPLYGLAHHCRDPFLRREGIELLRQCRRREGIWDSLLAARVAEKVMQIEEQGLGPVTTSADVPEWARVSNTEVSFDAEGIMGCVWYTRGLNPIFGGAGRRERFKATF